MDSNVNPQPTDAHIRISHEVHREILRRRFTQRQRVIIDFILSLSWGCGKPSALIPKLKHFEQCGIRKGHIKQELLGLVDMKVIFWDVRSNLFQFNKHYNQWEVEIVGGFDSSVMHELIRLNIDTPTPNMNQKVTESVTELPKKELEKVTELVTELPKKEPKSYQKGNSKVTEKVTGLAFQPLRIKRFRASKTMFKTNIKKDDAVVDMDSEFESILKAYCGIHQKLDMQVRPLDIKLMQELIALGVPSLLITRVMQQVHQLKIARGERVSSFAFYKNAITDAWEAEKAITEGVPIPEGVPLPPVALGSPQRKTKLQRELDELEKLREEALKCETPEPRKPRMSKRQQELNDLRRRAEEERRRDQR